MISSFLIWVVSCTVSGVVTYPGHPDSRATSILTSLSLGLYVTQLPAFPGIIKAQPVFICRSSSDPSSSSCLATLCQGSSIFGDPGLLAGPVWLSKLSASV